MNVVKEQKGSVLVVRLSGSIEENTNFELSIGAPAPEMHVYCKDVRRINSVGVKAWIKYFQGVQGKGSKLKFYECSTAIVEQVNLISNFACGGTVESIHVPFSCSSCKSELLGLFRADQIRQLNFNIPEVKCQKCGGKAVFDDIPEEYFSFLSRSS